MDKSWESEEEDSDTSGIAEGDDESGIRSGSSSSIHSARVVLETEIKFNEETAITMTILEEQDKDVESAQIFNKLDEVESHRVKINEEDNNEAISTVVDERKNMAR